MSSLIDIVGSISGGIGGIIKYRYMHSEIEGYTDIQASADAYYEEITIHERITPLSFPWIPIHVRTVVEISSFIKCKSIVLGDLSAYYDMNVIGNNKSIAVGKIKSAIVYELARREDEMFLEWIL